MLVIADLIVRRGPEGWTHGTGQHAHAYAGAAVNRDDSRPGSTSTRARRAAPLIGRWRVNRYLPVMGDAPSLIIPSEIPWDRLTSQSLEELLFWLCVELGGKDVQWRTGMGGPSADGGRDIEATFPALGDDGEVQAHRWWIQAKGRSSTVEPMAVKEAATTAIGFAEVEVVVVATNAGFSNPTRDWVREFNQTHARPTVVLWPRARLEELLVKNPSALLRASRRRRCRPRAWPRPSSGGSRLSLGSPPRARSAWSGATGTSSRSVLWRDWPWRRESRSMEASRNTRG
jgi:hypothetical protein